MGEQRLVWSGEGDEFEGFATWGAPVRSANRPVGRETLGPAAALPRGLHGVRRGRDPAQATAGLAGARGPDHRRSRSRRRPWTFKEIHMHFVLDGAIDDRKAAAGDRARASRSTARWRRPSATSSRSPIPTRSTRDRVRAQRRRPTIHDRPVEGANPGHRKVIVQVPAKLARTNQPSASLAGVGDEPHLDRRRHLSAARARRRRTAHRRGPHAVGSAERRSSPLPTGGAGAPSRHTSGRTSSDRHDACPAPAGPSPRAWRGCARCAPRAARGRCRSSCASVTGRDGDVGMPVAAGRSAQSAGRRSIGRQHDAPAVSRPTTIRASPTSGHVPRSFRLVGTRRRGRSRLDHAREGPGDGRRGAPCGLPGFVQRPADTGRAPGTPHGTRAKDPVSTSIVSLMLPPVHPRRSNDRGPCRDSAPPAREEHRGRGERASTSRCRRPSRSAGRRRT